MAKTAVKVTTGQQVARVITPAVARRLAITRQRLAGPRPAPDRDGIMEVARDLRALQLDPINVISRSHLLVLWSRLGAFSPADLAALLYQERQLFEYWAHCASIVLTEDYAIHRQLMQQRLTGQSVWEVRSRQWLDDNHELRQSILDRLRDDGPLPLKSFEDRAVRGWTSSGWTSGRNVARMIDHLWLNGTLMVAGRDGIHRLWDLAERVLPAWAPRELAEPPAVIRCAAALAIRALGVARQQHVNLHFTRGRYPGLAQALADLEANGTIVRVAIESDDEPSPAGLRGVWYCHSADLPLIDRLSAGDDWGPRTTLLSPFDNLICDRKRTQALFDFDFTIEIYVPKEKRRWGYYVLPILHGDRLIGRVDPAVNRSRGLLTINALHAEPDAPATPDAARAVASAIEELAAFVGAREITYTGAIPKIWKSAFH